MELITFSNPETAAAYEPLTKYDQEVHVPARVGEGKCYRGFISGIDPEAAARYIRFGGNLLKAKKTAKVVSFNK